MIELVETESTQKEMLQRAQTWPERAGALVIDSEWAMEEAGEMLSGINALLKEADRVFDPITTAAHQAHKVAVAAKKDVIDPLKEAKRMVNGSVAAYQDRIEAARKKEEQRLQAIADKEAEEQRLRDAIELEEAGEPEAAEMVMEAPSAPAPVIKLPPQPKVKGMSTRILWKARVTNKQELVRFIANNPALLHLVDINQSALDGIARSQKETMNYPGAQAYSERSIASR